MDADVLSKARPTTQARAETSDRFDERVFSQTIFTLCEEGKHEQAARYYLDRVPEFMALKLNAKEKLNHLMFLPRIIQGGAATKHGYAKLLNKASIVENAIDGYTLPSTGGFIDLGCGAHDPLALATYYYLNGFDKCYGIDLLEPRTSEYSAISMYDILVNARSFPKKYCRVGTEPAEILARLKPFKLGAFESGNFAGGFGNLKDAIEFRNEDICTSPIKKGSMRLIASFAVLEHVTDIDGVCKALYDLLVPGGYVYHFVDMADHRSYMSGSKFTALSFLTEEEAPANMNRLRAPEVTAAHERAGFEILKDKRTKVEVSDAFRAKVVKRFQKFTPDEFGVTKQVLLVRKPMTATGPATRHG